jgi:ankyrin repeat protein
MTSIDEIIRNDHKDLLQCVYERIKNVTRETNKQAGFGLMHLAASQPESRCLRYLLEEERETPNEICNEIDQSSPLHFAVLAGDYHNVKVLLNNGAAPNNRDREGNTPMHLAVATRNLQLVRLLEENFGNADIKNIDGVTAYDIAITENLQEIKLFFISQAKYA